MPGSENTRSEERRLEALDRYGVLGTGREKEFDDLVRLAARVCETGSAFLNFIERDRQWTKAGVGIEMPAVNRAHAICAHTILGDDVMVVADTTKDPRFVDNPLVTGAPHLRFYAGAPLITPAGERLGSLCVVDTKPRTLDEERIETLRAIARQVMAQLELRRKVAQLSEATTGRERAEEALRQRDTSGLPRVGKAAGGDRKTSSAATVAVWLAFILSLSITLVATWLSKSSVDRERAEIFAEQIEDFTAEVVDRLSAYEELQRAAAAFVSSSDKVTRPEWNHFVNSVAIERRYPGLRMTGLVELVSSGQREEFLRESREENGAFEIHPPGMREEHFVVRFVNPAGLNSAVEGFDLAADPARRLAARFSMEAGVPRATGKLALIQDPEKRPAFLVFYPIYRKDVPLDSLAQRRNALIGWVYLGVRVDELIEQLPSSSRHGLAVEIHADDGSDDILYASDWRGVSSLETRRTLDVYGQTWTLNARSRPELFERSRWGEPTGVFAGGLLLCALITGITWSLANTRWRALEIAGELTEAYDRSERFTRAIVDGIGDGTLTVNQEGRITSVNRAAEQIFGCSPSNLVGADIRDLLPSFQLDVDEGITVAVTATSSAGRPIDLEAVVNPLEDAGHQKLVIVRDVSERNRSERETRLLQSLSFWVAQSRDLDEAIKTVLEELCSLARWPYAESWLPDERSEVLAPGPSWHISEAEQAIIESDRMDVRHARGSGLAGKVWQSGQSLFERDLSAERVGLNRRTVLERGLRSALAVPVLADEEVVAVLVFFAPETTEEIESYTKVVTATAAQLGGIMQRKRASDALVESHNAMEAVLAAATEVSIIATDPYGTIRIFNRGAERMLGYKADEVVGRSTPEMIHLESEVDARGQVLSAILGREISGFDVFVEKARHGVVEEREWTYVRKDGEHLTVTLAVNSLRDADAKIIGFLGVAKDITLRNRAIHELRSSESRVRSIIESSLGGVITIDRFGMIESMNPAAESMFGYSETELVGRHFTVLLPVPEEQPSDFRSSRYAVAIGQVTEWQGRRRNGDVFPMEVSLFEFSSTAQINFAGHVMDVSKRHEVERMKRDFVSTVSHELRTPLTSIRGALGLLASGTLGQLDDDAREMVAVAERNSVRLIDLINDILDFERLDSGRMEMHPRRTTFRTIIERSLENVRTFADQAGVRLEVIADSGEVVADEDRIVQVLVNLLSNAIKFSPSGSSVTIDTARHDDLIECRVIDRGKGIAPEAQERLFQRFQQIDSSDRRERGGTGLGLAISKAIVQQHGGEIGVESAPGEGSTFWFQLPVEVDTSSKKDVLAIEGDETLLAVMRRQLESESVLIRTACTCAEGLAAIERRKPDLVILDVGLPDGDAYVLVEQLRRREAFRDLPVLVYTGRDLTYDQRNELRLGPTRFLLKSKSTGKDLRELMEELLRATESRPGESPDH